MYFLIHNNWTYYCIIKNTKSKWENVLNVAVN